MWKRWAAVAVIAAGVAGIGLWAASDADDPTDPIPPDPPEPPVARPPPEPAPTIAERAQSATVTGSVTRQGGVVAGARVVARSDLRVVEAETDGSGSFRLELPPGSYLLSATREGEASRLVGPIFVSAGERRNGITLELLAAATVSGTVFDAARRQPIAGATVKSSGGIAVTDHAGRFRLTGLPADTTWIEASAQGYLPRLEWLSVGGAREHGGMELYLRPAAVLSGTVVRQGQPVAGASVWAEALVLGAEGRTFGPVATDRDGRYELFVEGGALQLAAAAPGGGRIEGPKVRAGEGARLDGLVIELGQALALEGVLLVSGMPAAGAHLSLLDARTHAFAGVAQSGAGGQFRFEGVPPATYLVHVQRGSLVAQRGPYVFTGEPGALWTVDVDDTRTLTGRVLPASSGVVVRFRATDWAGTSPGITTTDGQGRFRFEGVPDGLLWVQAEGAAGAAEARARAGEEVVLTLRPAVLRGRVVDERGRAVTDFTVRLRPLSSGWPRSFPVLSPDGEFKVQAPPGPYEVTATAAGYGDVQSPRRVELEGAESISVTLVLSSTSPLRGVVLDAKTGAPIPGVEVTFVRGEAGGARYAGRFATLVTAADGTFQLEAAPRRAVLSFRKDGYVTAWGEADGLPRDEQGRMVARLHPGATDPLRSMTEYEGIGAQLHQAKGGEPVVVRHVFVDSPAEAAGLLPGDRIVAVDGAPVAGLGVDAVIARILGPSGTVVVLTIERGAERVDLPIRRRTIHF